MPSPIIYTWTGETMEPMKRFQKLADKEFVVGENYRMETIEERSHASHNHYFASLQEAWKNLPENIAEIYPTSEHLRKRALIEANFYDEEIIDCETKSAAIAVAPAIRKRDDFAMIFVRGRFIIIRTAKSQSKKAMGDKIFQASKSAVLEIISQMVGVPEKELETQAGKSA